ncbi:MAG: putative transposase [Oceanicoccus sp.]|jgi:putative transposase
MSGRPRQYLPGMFYQVRQRGNNRQACFVEVADYQRYLDFLSLMLELYQVSPDAHVLMTNHLHQLFPPLFLNRFANWLTHSVAYNCEALR